ncbi:uncharacterized protein (DUF433 family) [Salinibacter ruber]|uniref:DUF433 domain-containing protein n=1 Tax=Salinibacter ruber TaxID=146919 RepID=UPI00216A4ECB|nr:DUF433 domain-containing protein [Salinibacter ruber]MCS3675567.1 uncharacterized protein (DUF433 family) [Salinibacter ruber]MCS4184955.1 uncharacterized protein (DUF433 family) [Salinibacter ruber]
MREDDPIPKNAPIEVSPGKRGGEPVFRGTRIPISFLAQYLSHGYTTEDFIGQYDIDPDLVREVYRRKFGDEKFGDKDEEGFGEEGSDEEGFGEEGSGVPA